MPGRKNNSENQKTPADILSGLLAEFSTARSIDEFMNRELYAYCRQNGIDIGEAKKYVSLFKGLQSYDEIKNNYTDGKVGDLDYLYEAYLRDAMRHGEDALVISENLDLVAAEGPRGEDFEEAVIKAGKKNNVVIVKRSMPDDEDADYTAEKEKEASLLAKNILVQTEIAKLDNSAEMGQNYPRLVSVLLTNPEYDQFERRDIKALWDSEDPNKRREVVNRAFSCIAKGGDLAVSENLAEQMKNWESFAFYSRLAECFDAPGFADDINKAVGGSEPAADFETMSALGISAGNIAVGYPEFMNTVKMLADYDSAEFDVDFEKSYKAGEPENSDGEKLPENVEAYVAAYMSARSAKRVRGLRNELKEITPEMEDEEYPVDMPQEPAESIEETVPEEPAAGKPSILAQIREKLKETDHRFVEKTEDLAREYAKISLVNERKSVALEKQAAEEKIAAERHSGIIGEVEEDMQYEQFKLASAATSDIKGRADCAARIIACRLMLDKAIKAEKDCKEAGFTEAETRNTLAQILDKSVIDSMAKVVGGSEAFKFLIRNDNAGNLIDAVKAPMNEHGFITETKAAEVNALKNVFVKIYESDVKEEQRLEKAKKEEKYTEYLLGKNRLKKLDGSLMADIAGVPGDAESYEVFTGPQLEKISMMAKYLESRADVLRLTVGNVAYEPNYRTKAQYICCHMLYQDMAEQLNDGIEAFMRREYGSPKAAFLQEMLDNMEGADVDNAYRTFDKEIINRINAGMKNLIQCESVKELDLGNIVRIIFDRKPNAKDTERFDAVKAELKEMQKPAAEIVKGPAK